MSSPPSVPWTVKKSVFHTLWFKRLVVGHVVSYAIVLPYAVGFIPLILRTMTLDELHAKDPSQFVLHRLIAPTIAVFVVAHLPALPWMLGKDAARGKRMFIALDILLAAIGIAGALVGWWLLLYRWTT